MKTLNVASSLFLIASLGRSRSSVRLGRPVFIFTWYGTPTIHAMQCPVYETVWTMPTPADGSFTARLVKNTVQVMREIVNLSSCYAIAFCSSSENQPTPRAEILTAPDRELRSGHFTERDTAGPIPA